MKRLPLSPEEIKNISLLLLNESEESAELGYELIKQNPTYIPELIHELVLILVLGPTGRLHKKVRSFLSSRFKADGQYERWKKEWEVFKKLDYSYSYSPETKLLLDAHETVREAFIPYSTQNRNYAQRYYEVGRILQYRYEKEFELAVAYYEIAVKGNPEHKDAWFNLGYLSQIQFKNNSRAKACYETALRLDPNMAVAYNNLGVIIINEEDDYERALGYYEKAVELAPHYDFYKSNVASTALKLGDELRFEEIIKEIFASDRYYQRAVNQWANYLWEYKKDYAAAEKEYRLGLRSYPNDPNLLGNLGEMFTVAMGQHEEAYSWYLKSLAQQRSPYRLTTMVSLLALHLNRLEEAKTFYEELVALKQKENLDRPRDLNDLQWEEFLQAESLIMCG